MNGLIIMEYARKGRPVADMPIGLQAAHWAHFPQYKGVSKSPRTMLIPSKSLVVHEFPTRVCCSGVL